MAEGMGMTLFTLETCFTTDDIEVMTDRGR